jgi:hypothetical protein
MVGMPGAVVTTPMVALVSSATSIRLEGFRNHEQKIYYVIFYEAELRSLFGSQDSP